MDRYDWPLLAVISLAVVAITLALRGLRTIVGLAIAACLLLRSGRLFHSGAGFVRRVRRSGI